MRFSRASATATVVLGFALAAACGSSDATPSGGDADSGIPQLDASLHPDAVVPQPPGSDGGEDAGSDTGSGPTDTTPPDRVGDLAGSVTSHTVIALTWTAPNDDSGKAASYDLRWSKTAFVDDASFAAATSVPSPTPAAPGTVQNTNVTGLTPDTTYYFALRAKDAAGNVGPISNQVAIATKARATLLVSEVALANSGTDGADFVELVAKTGGWAEGIEIRQASGTLYTLSAFDVAVGDYIVVHTTGGAPAGGAQEDVTKAKTSSTEPFATAGAWDVYAASTGLTSTDELISVLADGKTVDAVALSNRDGDAAASTMTAWAGAKTAAAWTFAATPADGANDCATQHDAVNVGSDDGPCGAFASGVASGFSVNRIGTTDTDGKADFYVAAMTPGAANAAIPAPTLVSAIATSATSAELRFSQDLGPVAAAAFTASGGLVVSAATADANVVTLTTSAQAGGAYDVTIANTVKSAQGLAVPSPVRFCAYSAVSAALTMREVNPNVQSQQDLLELLVTQGGSLSGFQVRASPTTTGASGTLLATLPPICATTGDLVVVHFAPVGAPLTAATSETVAKDELLRATYGANFDGAWDVLGNKSTLSATNVVLALRSPAGAYVEAVPFTDNGGAASSVTFVSSMAFVQGAGLWLPADCGGVACTDATVPTIKQIAASWQGVGTTPGGASANRVSAAKDKTAWSVGASSFGQ